MKHMRRQLTGYHGLEPDIIFDNEAESDPEHPMNGAWSGQVKDYWADVWTYSPEWYTTQKQWQEMLKEDPEARCPDAREYFWENHTREEFGFNTWTDNVTTFSPTSNNEWNEPYGYDLLWYGYQVNKMNTGAGKQIILEEGDTWVFLWYRVKKNGDKIHVKAVYNKNDIQPGF